VGEALAWTARWYQAYYDDPKSAAFMTEGQIRAFSAMVDQARGNS
jgi:hypothetical protein